MSQVLECRERNTYAPVPAATTRTVLTWVDWGQRGSRECLADTAGRPEVVGRWSQFGPPALGSDPAATVPWLAEVGLEPALSRASSLGDLLSAAVSRPSPRDAAAARTQIAARAVTKARALAQKFFPNAQLTVTPVECEGESYARLLIATGRDSDEAAQIYDAMMTDALTVLSDDECRMVSLVVS